MDTTNTDSHSYLIGRSYTFEDGNWIQVTQIKRRDDGYWVTYLAKISPTIPKQGTMPMPQFIEQYSHLFTQNS